MSANERRRRTRHSMPGRVKLHWRTPDGNSIHTSGECLDISSSGMLVKIDRRVEAGTLIRVESGQFRLAGVAHVRHCRAQGLQFIAGIEYAGGLTWNGPQSV